MGTLQHAFNIVILSFSTDLKNSRRGSGVTINLQVYQSLTTPNTHIPPVANGTLKCKLKKRSISINFNGNDVSGISSIE